MTPLLKNTRAGYLRRRQAILKELAKREPVLAAELESILVALDQPEIKPGEYALVHTPMKAILKYLNDRESWADRTTMCREIVNGGYGKNPVRDTGYLGEAIDRATEGGKLVQVQNLIGLPNWSRPFTDSGK